MNSDDVRYQGRSGFVRPGPGMVVTFKCDYCKQSRSVSEGRRRVRGLFWRCQPCEKAAAK